MKRILFIFGLLAVILPGIAQDQCAFILEEAQEMFDAGLIETIPVKLAGCMESGFTKEEQLQAHKLIILSYLFDDDVVAADKAMLQFLSEFPAYQPLATDPREFVTLMSTYDTRPILMMGGSLGANFTFPLPVRTIGIYNYDDFKGSYLPGGAGFHGSFRIDKRITGGLEVTAELMYSYNRFDFYLENDTETPAFTGEITDFSRIDYYENQNRISLPLNVNYAFSRGAFTPVILAGVSPGLTLSATGEGYREYVNTGDVRFDPVPVAGVDILPMRRIFNAWAFAGAGLEYKLGPGEVFVDARIYVNLLNQVRPGSDRFVQKLVFESFYVSDDLLLNYVTVSAGYMFPIYKPKKKVE